MREKFKYFWHYLLPIPLYSLYYFINVTFLVDIFGCSCPKFDEDMNLLPNQFNTNDFTRLFWLFVALALAIISIIISRRIEGRRKKFIYLICSVIVTTGLSFLCLLATPMAK